MGVTGDGALVGAMHLVRRGTSVEATVGVGVGVVGCKTSTISQAGVFRATVSLIASFPDSLSLESSPISSLFVEGSICDVTRHCLGHFLFCWCLAEAGCLTIYLFSEISGEGSSDVLTGLSTETAVQTIPLVGWPGTREP